jgi:hypothetical protein
MSLETIAPLSDTPTVSLPSPQPVQYRRVYLPLTNEYGAEKMFT